MKETANKMVAMQLHDRGIITDEALKKALNIDHIINTGSSRSSFDEEQLVLQLWDKKVVTRKEVIKYFGIENSEIAPIK